MIRRSEHPVGEGEHGSMSRREFFERALDVAVSAAGELTVETSAPLVVTAVELRSP